jgi:hypothetical protein
MSTGVSILHGMTQEDNIKMGLQDISEGGKFLELDQSYVQKWAMVFVVLNLQVLIPEH